MNTLSTYNATEDALEFWGCEEFESDWCEYAQEHIDLDNFFYSDAIKEEYFIDWCAKNV